MNIRLFTALLAGLCMGMGILISDMSNPAKILGFLDLAGNWDPSLGLVILTAILVAMPAFMIVEKRHASLLGESVELPSTRLIDGRLIGGSIAFGIGWGLTGICPGPALIMLGKGMIEGLIVTLAILAGFALFDLIQRFTPPPQ